MRFIIRKFHFAISVIAAVAVALVMLLGALPASATPFEVNFDTSFACCPTTFDSGGFTFTFLGDGDGGDFAWSGAVGEDFGSGPTAGILVTSLAIDTGSTEVITIVLTGGGNFTWNSLWINSIGTSTTVEGLLLAATVFTTTPALGIATISTGGVVVDTVRLKNVDFFGNFDSFKGDLEMDTGGSVPEPGTLALFGFGLLGLGLARRRGKRA